MTKCYSVRLKSLESISSKCYKAVCFDGSSDLIPKSQVFGVDFSVTKSDAYWITEWILEKKSITYSRKKWTMFSKGKNIGQYEYKHHIPKKIELKNIKYNEALKRSKNE
jgi:prolyl oligopeptidase PreP (S9A serine peptidase family)